MSLLFSRQCEYALQAVLYLALQRPGAMTSIKELTARLEIPYHYLGKILQDLKRRGLLESLKGPSGGFRLRRSAEEITLFQVVEAIDGEDLFQNCVLGFQECSARNPCPVHARWGTMRDEIRDMLVSKSIAQLARETRKRSFLSVKA